MNFADNLMRKGYLISPNLLKEKDLDENIINKLENLKEKPLVIDKNVYKILKNSDDFTTNISWKEFDKSKVYYEKNKNIEDYNIFLDILNYNLNEENKIKLNNLIKQVSKPQKLELEKDIIAPNVVVVKIYNENIKKREVQDFVHHFKARYNSLKNILINRPELNGCISINRVLNKNNGDKISIIGLIIDKKTTKNGNIIFEVEDLTGKVNCVIGKNKKDVYESAQDFVLDEVVGIIGTYSDNIIFINNLLLPGIPLSNQLKKIDEECYSVFTSDIHIGSRVFLEKEFSNFIDWLNGNYGNDEQKKISSKVKYLFLVGDLVEGVGIYPNQEKDLLIKDVKKQYEKLAELLGKIRKDIFIIVIGGNHDSLRLAEPQPKLNITYAKPLYEIENVIILTNPSLVNIHSSNYFEGFNVLMYHGSSFHSVCEFIESVRLNGGLNRPDLIMKHLLQARHLAPLHNSVQYIPENDEDFLVIDKVPDFFVSGDIHRTTALNYRGVTLLNCSCWAEQTEYQEKRGIVNDPGKAFVVNLKTREIKIFNFIENETI